MRTVLVTAAAICVICLVIPGLDGAEGGSCPSSNDAVISSTVKEAASKKTVKSEEENKKTEQERDRASNGLVSGAKKLTLSRSRSLTDEEQKQRSAEKVTASGSEKVSESLKKKKEVDVSEKKSVLIYYMVSYKRLPNKKDDESRVDYYKRIFPKEKNLHVFYRKIFKAYEKEEPKAYIERVEYILDNVYPELDCRLDMEQLSQLDHYYTIKYSRKVDECDEHYYDRVLKRATGESCEHYKKRMDVLVACLDTEDFSHITFDNSEVGYKVGKRKTPVKKTSSDDSSGDATGMTSTTSRKSRALQQDVDKKESSVNQKNAQGTVSETEKSVKKRKLSVEKEEDTKMYAYRVAYTKLPKKKVGELDEVYYKRFFGEYNPKMSENERNELYLKILIQYKGENCTEYVDRIDFLFDKVYPKLDIRTNKVIITLLEHYYKEKYVKLEGETEEKWYARVLTKKPCETPEQYKNRVDCMKETLEEISWSKITIDEKSATGYTFNNCACAKKT